MGEEDKFCAQCGHGLSQGPSRTPDSGTETAEESPQVSVFGLTVEAIRSLFTSSPVQATPSGSVYAKRPPKPLGRFFVVAVVITAIGLFVSYGQEWLSYYGYTLSGFAAPVFYLVWMVRNDRYEREPLTLVALTFGWGAFCAIFAAFLNSVVAVPLFGMPGAAFIEEPLKLLGVYWVARHHTLGSELNDHLDGMIYGAAAGAGFAGLENLSYIMMMILGEGAPPFLAIVVRSAVSFNHIAWSAMAGRSLGLAKALNGKSRLVDLIPGLIVVVPLHFMWNLVSPAVALFILLPFNLVVLLRLVRSALSDEVRWGFLTSAPVE